MTNWSSYQSLIQLAAALNFAFAGFDFLLSRHIEGAKVQRMTRLEEIIAARKSGGLLPNISAAKNTKIKNRLEFLEKIEAFKTVWNAWLSVISGLISIVILGYASVNADKTPEFWLLAWCIFAGYFWFALSNAWMLAGRLYLHAFVLRLYNR